MSLLTQSFYQPIPVKPRAEHEPEKTSQRECNRLVCAAVVNKRFRDMLLANPVQSIEAGYSGEHFSFTREEKEQIRQIHAHSLEEFAFQLMRVIEKPVVSEMAYIRRK